MCVQWKLIFSETVYVTLIPNFFAKVWNPFNLQSKYLVQFLKLQQQPIMPLYSKISRLCIKKDSYAPFPPRPLTNSAASPFHWMWQIFCKYNGTSMKVWEINSYIGIAPDSGLNNGWRVSLQPNPLKIPKAQKKWEGLLPSPLNLETLSL